MNNPLATISGMPVSRAIFGTMQFGEAADRDASQQMYIAARNAEINHFDTAYPYTNGASEQLLGEFARHERDDIFISTKVGYVGGAGRDNISNQFTMSIDRLSIDVVDLLYLHRFDPETLIEETFETLTELQTCGRIRHIGVSNYAAWQVMKAQAVAQSFGTQIDAVQPMYSLVKRQAEVEILPMCLDQDLLAATYSPLGGGLLTGKYATGGTGRLTDDPRYQARYSAEHIHDTAQQFSELASNLEVSPTSLAIAWVLAGPYAANPIISARSAEQLVPSLAGLDIALDAETYERITALSLSPSPATDRLEEV